MARRRRRSTHRTGSGGALRAMDVQVLGVEELRIVFKAIPEKAQKTIVADGLEAGGAVVLGEQVRHVPIDSGTLLQSLQVFPVHHGKLRARVSVGAGPEGFYGRFLEYGTQHMPARPWLRPALDGAFSGTVRAFRNEFAAGLDPMVRALRATSGG